MPVALYRPPRAKSPPPLETLTDRSCRRTKRPQAGSANAARRVNFRMPTGLISPAMCAGNDFQPRIAEKWRLREPPGSPPTEMLHRGQRTGSTHDKPRGQVLLPAMLGRTAVEHSSAKRLLHAR